MTTPQAVDNSSDMTAKQQAKPLRSALRSTEPKVTHNDMPSKSAKNKSASPMTDRKVDRIDTPLDLSGGSERAGGRAVDGTTVVGGGGTTLSDLKRQRAQTRRPPESSPSMVPKSTTSAVGNGDISSGDHHEPRLRLTSPEFVTVEEKQERSCCVII